jgi:pimeloyl-ACP methyl ester carboxylesterase
VGDPMRSFFIPVALLMALTSVSRALGQGVATQSGSFDSNGVKIAYVTAGKGEPVILVHGLYSSAQMNWQAPGTFDLLAQHFQVIALDLRGHGKSDKPTGDADYGQPMVEDIVGLMDHLKIQKAHMVGYSLGGIIVTRLMIDHPERVRSGALGGIAWLRQGSGLQGFWATMQPRDNGRTPPACVHGIARLAVTADQIKSIKTPVEILVGDRDPCKRLYVDPLQSVRNDWPVVLIKDAGHFNCIVKDKLKQGLLEWLVKNARK